MIANNSDSIKIGSSEADHLAQGHDLIYSKERNFDIYVRFSGTVPLVDSTGAVYISNVSTGIDWSGAADKYFVRGTGKNNSTLHEATSWSTNSLNENYPTPFSGGDDGETIEVSTTYQKVYTTNKFSRLGTPSNNSLGWSAALQGRGIAGFGPYTASGSGFQIGADRAVNNPSNTTDATNDTIFPLTKITYNTSANMGSGYSLLNMRPTTAYPAAPVFEDSWAFILFPVSLVEGTRSGQFKLEDHKLSPVTVRDGKTGIFFDITGIQVGGYYGDL